MPARAAITVNRPREEVERQWASAERLEGIEAQVTFRDAPGDRGTELHVEVARDVPGGRVGELVEELVSTGPRAKAMDELRRFKQLVETGEVARSEGSPEGERFERKGKQRPAQPLSEDEREKVGV